MNMSSFPRRTRAALIFLTFALAGPLAGGIILGFAGSSYLAPMIEPDKNVDATIFAYIVLIAFAFVTLPAAITGLVVTLKFLNSGFFRPRFAMFMAFVSSGLAGPAYHYIYAGNKPTGHELINSALVSYLVVGPIAALCAFLSQRAAIKLGLMSAGTANAELGK